MIKLVVALLFAATVYSAYIEVENSGHNFRISVNPASEVRWTKDGNNYRHLQELSQYCSNPGTPVAQGGIGNWQCGPYDTLANLNCTVSGGLFNPIIKEVDGVFQCATELDTLAELNEVCTDGQTVKFVGGAWQCAADEDTFRDLQITCPSGSTIQWNGAVFECVTGTGISDSDILAGLSCAEGQLPRFNGVTFECANDYDTVPSGCSNGQLIAYTGTEWVCRDDEDYLAQNTIPSCSGATPYLKYRNNAWVCSPYYYVMNVIGDAGFLTYLQSANILQQTDTPQEVNSYNVLWGSISQATLFSTAAPVFPFNGTITSTYVTFQNWDVSVDTRIKIRFAVGGVEISPAVEFDVNGVAGAQSFNYLSPVFTGQNFQAGQTVSLGFDVMSGSLKTSPPLLSSVYVAVYISVSI